MWDADPKRDDGGGLDAGRGRALGRRGREEGGGDRRRQEEGRTRQQGVAGQGSGDFEEGETLLGQRRCRRPPKKGEAGQGGQGGERAANHRGGGDPPSGPP